MRVVWLLSSLLTVLLAFALVLAFVPAVELPIEEWAVGASLGLSVVVAIAIFTRIASLARRCCDDDPKGAGERDDKWDRLSGLADATGAEAQNLIEILELIRKAARAKGNRVQAVAQAIRDAEEYLRRNASDIANRLDEAKALLDRDGHLYRQSGRDIVEMANAWERARGIWPVARDFGPNPDVEEVLERVTEAISHLDAVVLAGAHLTIPPQVYDWAASKNPGDQLSFHETFKRELRRENHRTEILKWLASATGTFPGIVDLDTGMIRVASPKRSRRLGTWVIIANAVLWGAVVATAAPTISLAVRAGDSGFDGLSTAESLALYAGVLLGGFAHFAIDALKTERSSEGGPRGVESIALWIHVHEREILWAVVALWATWLLWLLFDVDPEWWVAFVIGYSADSFFDLFIGKFTAGIGGKLKTVQQRFTAGGAS